MSCRLRSSSLVQVLAHLDDGDNERAECRRARVKPQALLQGPPERAVIYL